MNVGIAPTAVPVQGNINLEAAQFQQDAYAQRNQQPAQEIEVDGGQDRQVIIYESNIHTASIFLQLQLHGGFFAEGACPKSALEYTHSGIHTRAHKCVPGLP